VENPWLKKPESQQTEEKMNKRVSGE